MVPHNLAWPLRFEQESLSVAAALGDHAVAVHHIGSTSIPGIWAKPIIDLLVEVSAIASVDERVAAMEHLGYEAMGEYGILGRRYFRKEVADGVRTHHVHVFEANSSEARRHLRFRDYLIAHPDEAQAYSYLKRRLAKAHPADIGAYMDGKDGLIKEIDAKAAAWRASS